MSRVYTSKDWIAAGIAFVVVVGAFAWMQIGGRKSPEERVEASASDRCRQWIKESAKHPSSARVPGPSRVQTFSDSIVVTWVAGEGLTLMNGFGANVDTAARCTMSKDGVFLKELVIDGQLVKRSRPK